MLGIIYWAARQVSRWFRLADHPCLVQARVGLVGLMLLVAAEIWLALQLGGQSPAEYVASHDPVSGTAYALSLVLFGHADASHPRAELDERGRERSQGAK